MAIILGATTKFLIDPIAWLISIGLAFLTRKNSFFVRLSLVWITSSLMAFLFLGVTKGYQYLAISIAYSIIAVASVLIVKSKRIEKKFQYLTNPAGEELHNQIYSAMNEDEEFAGRNLTKMKATGYIFGFINHHIQDSNFNDDEQDEIYKIILNGVLPDKLEKIYIKNTARYELAISTKGLEHEVENFNIGQKWGEYDASLSDCENRPDSLKSILLGKKPKVTIKKNKDAD